MPVTADQLSDFQSFAADALARDEAESMEHLFDLWVLAHPTPKKADSDLAAIERGIAEADAGRTVPLEQAFGEVRQTLRKKA